MQLLIFLILVSCRQVAIKCIGIRVSEMLKGISLYNSVQFKSPVTQISCLQSTRSSMAWRYSGIGKSYGILFANVHHELVVISELPREWKCCRKDLDCDGEQILFRICMVGVNI